MARPLRVEIPGGWYHLTARGNERKSIFRTDRDRLHFLELIEELVKRFRWRIHAYVLMNNHYHLQVETPEVNLSEGMRWLHVSYSVWFNRKHHRVGHLFQGRFKAILVEPDSWGVSLSQYIHLNPIRVKAFVLDRASRVRRRHFDQTKPTQEELARRLEHLREYRWSSYPAYVGRTGAPTWLARERILERMGRGGPKAQRREYEKTSERLACEGMQRTPWVERVGMFLGKEDWVQEMKELSHGKVDRQEHREALALIRRPSWEEIVNAVEKEKGEKWGEFRDRHGDWGRDVALWLGRMKGGLKLAQLGKLAGGMNYRSVYWAVSQMSRRRERDEAIRNVLARLGK